MAPAHAYRIVRDITLTRYTSVWGQLEAIRGHYRALTGLHLSCEDAVRCLDQIRAERQHPTAMTEASR